jgi:hypothetical protein
LKLRTSRPLEHSVFNKKKLKSILKIHYVWVSQIPICKMESQILAEVATTAKGSNVLSVMALIPASVTKIWTKRGHWRLPIITEASLGVWIVPYS